MRLVMLLTTIAMVGLCSCAAGPSNRSFERYVLKYESPVDASLQAQVEEIDASLRQRYGHDHRTDRPSVCWISGPAGWP